MSKSEDNRMVQCFKYPLFYRLQYLWSLAAIAVVTVFAVGYLFQTRDPIAIGLALVVAVPMLIQVYISEQKSSLLPVEIRIEDGWISLYRFSRYRRFQLSYVIGIRTNQNPGYAPITGGWVEVEYESDGKRQFFYIGPYISGFVELVDILRSVAGHCPVEKALFCWPKKLRFFQWVGAVGVVTIAAVSAISIFLDIHGVWQAVHAVAYLMVIISIIWGMGTSPICVEVGEDRIVFKFPIRPDVVVCLHDILSVDTGGGLTFLSFNINFSSICLRNGRKLVLAPYFEDYTDMVNLLREKMHKPH